MTNSEPKTLAERRAARWRSRSVGGFVALAVAGAGPAIWGGAGQAGAGDHAVARWHVAAAQDSGMNATTTMHDNDGISVWDL